MGDIKKCWSIRVCKLKSNNVTITCTSRINLSHVWQLIELWPSAAPDSGRAPIPDSAQTRHSYHTIVILCVAALYIYNKILYENALGLYIAFGNPWTPRTHIRIRPSSTYGIHSDSESVSDDGGSEQVIILSCNDLLKRHHLLKIVYYGLKCVSFPLFSFFVFLHHYSRARI